jgi:hypothetical protein
MPRDPPKEKISADEKKKLDKLPRHCMNWACERIYSDERNHKKACLAHTGRWDFGHTGVNVSRAAEAGAMWEPHWTCCRKDWESEGCTRLMHFGPYLEEYAANPPRKYQWPDPRVQSYFRKNISILWKRKIEQ